MLRAVSQVAENIDDALYVMTQLYIEQKVGLRQEVGSLSKSGGSDPRTPNNIMKAILLRKNYAIVLKSLCPQFASVVDYYLECDNHRDKHGVNANGYKDPVGDLGYSESKNNITIPHDYNLIFNIMLNNMICSLNIFNKWAACADGRLAERTFESIRKGI